MSRWRKLLAQRNSGPIGVGLVGATYMGTGVLGTVKNAIGMEIVAIHDADKAKATKAAADYAPKAKILELEELCADGAVEVGNWVITDGNSKRRPEAHGAGHEVPGGRGVRGVRGYARHSSHRRADQSHPRVRG